MMHVPLNTAQSVATGGIIGRQQKAAPEAR